MSRNLVAIVSSVMFVGLAALLMLVPVPFVTWRPGVAVDVLGATDGAPLVQVTGLETHEATGKLLLTTVSTTRADGSIGLPEALMAYFSSDSDTLPRDAIFPPGSTGEQVHEQGVAAMDTSKDNATVAALRAAGQQVTEMPVVETVSLSGPAKDKLEPGDLIESIDGEKATTRDDVATIVRNRPVGDPVVFKVLRGGNPQTISVVTVADGQSRPMVGITVGVGYRFAPEVHYNLDPGIVGPSAGLVFALAIYDKVTDGVLMGETVVAGTGGMDASGRVQAIGGIRSKMAAARKAGATVFVFPKANCADIGSAPTGMLAVPVASLKDAIATLKLLKEGQATMEVPRCE